MGDDGVTISPERAAVCLTQITATVRTEPSPKRVRALIGGVVGWARGCCTI